MSSDVVRWRKKNSRTVTFPLEPAIFTVLVYLWPLGAVVNNVSEVARQHVRQKNTAFYTAGVRTNNSLIVLLT